MDTPDQKMLKKYADILVKFALRGGKWAKKGEVVFVQIPECAKAFYLPLQEAILEVGAYPIFEYLADGVTRNFYELATEDQITFLPRAFLSGKVEEMTHIISIIAEADKYELQGIDPNKISKRIASRKEYVEKRTQKESEGKMSWTIALFGTPAMAKEVWMTLEEYWDQIIQACYLDDTDPIERWKETQLEIATIVKRLNELKIQKVHVEGEDADLWITIWSNRQRLGWSGSNIPSFEIFTSPDYRYTQWWMKFNQKLYKYGQLIDGIFLEFKDGEVCNFDARVGKELLQEIFTIPWTKFLWEFSLTDAKHSRITKYMGEILYDENVGGEFWNTHIAIGRSLEGTYVEDASKLTEQERKHLWFNQSTEHTDIISTTDRKVTAILEDGSEKVIYQWGHFLV